jgi:hypothetical protein
MSDKITVVSAIDARGTSPELLAALPEILNRNNQRLEAKILNALTEDPSTNAPAVKRGTDGPTLEAISNSHPALGADGTTSRPVEGSSVGELHLPPKGNFRRRLLLRREAGKRLTVTMTTASKESVLLLSAWDEIRSCYLDLSFPFLSIKGVSILVSEQEVERIRKVFPDLLVIGAKR